MDNRTIFNVCPRNVDVLMCDEINIDTALNSKG